MPIKGLTMIEIHGCVCFCYISSTKIQIRQGNLKGLLEVFKVGARTGDQRSRPGITHICVE